MRQKYEELEQAGGYYHAITTTEDVFKNRMGVFWNAFLIIKLLSFPKYSLRQKYRCIRTGADQTNQFRESIYDYRYKLLEEYYKRYLEPTIVASTNSPVESEEIRCLFSVIEEVAVKNYYNIDELVFSDDLVLDVGANVGIYSIAVKELFPNVRIIGFEPSAQSFATASQNLKRYDGITLHKKGLGDKNETKKIEISSNILVNKISDSPEFDMKTDPLRTEDVEIARLDDILNEKADVIKIDIEGYEAKALQGASAYIKTHQPLIICAIEHTQQQKDNLIRLMGSIDSRYEVEPLNDCNICFYVPSLHNDRIARLKAGSGKVTG